MEGIITSSDMNYGLRNPNAAVRLACLLGGVETTLYLTHLSYQIHHQMIVLTPHPEAYKYDCHGSRAQLILPTPKSGLVSTPVMEEFTLISIFSSSRLADQCLMQGMFRAQSVL